MTKLKTLIAAVAFATVAISAQAATVFKAGTTAGGSQFAVNGDITVGVFDPYGA